MRLLLTGGTGFIGKPLCAALIRRGHELLVLTRHPQAQPPQAGVTFLSWDHDEWQAALQGIDGVVNLAGEPIAAARWTPRQKQRIRDSRVHTVRRLMETLASRPARIPSVVVSASAIGYYGARADELLDESAAPGSGFLAEVCREWEAEALRAQAQGVRVVVLRVGLVLGPEGGALAKMAPPFRWYVGGPLGGGQQWISWIHRDDVIGLIEWALRGEQSGPVNATAPEPVRMREFASTLGRLLQRPSWLPVPAIALRLLMGEMADLLLTGQRVIPHVALRSGYVFQYPQLRPALEACFAP